MTIVAIVQFWPLTDQSSHDVGRWLDFQVGRAADGHVYDQPDTYQKVGTVGEQCVVHEDVVADDANKEPVTYKISPFPFDEADIELIVGPFPQEKEYTIEEALAND